MAFDPKTVGDEMIVAGEGQVSTGKALKKAAGYLRGFADSLDTDGQVATSIGSIRGGATAIRSLLSPVVTALQFIVNAFNGFTVPTVTPQTSNVDIPVVGRVRFVTGVTVGSTKPLAGVAARIDTVRENLADIREALNTMTTGLRDLGKALPDIKTNVLDSAKEIDNSGTLLVASGNALQSAGTSLGGN